MNDTLLIKKRLRHIFGREGVESQPLSLS